MRAFLRAKCPAGHEIPPSIAGKASRSVSKRFSGKRHSVARGFLTKGGHRRTPVARAGRAGKPTPPTAIVAPRKELASDERDGECTVLSSIRCGPSMCGGLYAARVVGVAPEQGEAPCAKTRPLNFGAGCEAIRW